MSKYWCWDVPWTWAERKLPWQRCCRNWWSKKEDVTLLLVGKKRRSAGADSEGSGSAPDDLEQKTASGFGTDCGKTGDTGRTVFLCQRNGRISDARRVWKETVWKTV